MVVGLRWTKQNPGTGGLFPGIHPGLARSTLQPDGHTSIGETGGRKCADRPAVGWLVSGLHQSAADLLSDSSPFESPPGWELREEVPVRGRGRC